jgi:hypothetical protein
MRRKSWYDFPETRGLAVQAGAAFGRHDILQN